MKERTTEEWVDTMYWYVCKNCGEVVPNILNRVCVECLGAPRGSNHDEDYFLQDVEEDDGFWKD